MVWTMRKPITQAPGSADRQNPSHVSGGGKTGRRHETDIAPHQTETSGRPIGVDRPALGEKMFRDNLGLAFPYQILLQAEYCLRSRRCETMPCPERAPEPTRASRGPHREKPYALEGVLEPVNDGDPFVQCCLASPGTSCLDGRFGAHLVEVCDPRQPA